MAYVFAIPAILSLLVLAAHFLRAGVMALVIVPLVLIVMLIFRQKWITRLVQFVLFLAALEWIRATLALVNERQAEGAPWQRAAVIMLSVEAFTVLSAIALQWFVRRRPRGFEVVASEQTLPPTT